MKVIAGIQIYEEEDFIKPTLLSLLQLCHTIIIVEGCWENTLTITKSKRSRDKTIEIIKDVMEHYDHEQRIELHYYNGKNQQEHRKYILNLALKHNPDWYLQGDGDEIFHEKEIPLLLETMKTTHKNAINPNHKLFWNDLEHYEIWRPSGRFFKLSNLDVTKIIYTGCNSYGYLGNMTYFSRDNMLLPDNIYIYHPSYVKNFQRQLLKWNHRSLDDRNPFPHGLDYKLSMVYRKTYKNAIDFQNSLHNLSNNDLPLVLQFTTDTETSNVQSNSSTNS
jgi:hypothetical protein